MKKQTCFLVGGIITSISNHTNQCVIVIMVTALKANFKGGRIVAEYRQRKFTLDIREQLPLCWGWKYGRNKSVGSWGAREGENTIQTKAGVQALRRTKWARLEDSRPSGQKRESQPEEEGQSEQAFISFPSVCKWPVPRTFESSHIYKYFLPFLLLCEQSWFSLKGFLRSA